VTLLVSTVATNVAPALRYVKSDASVLDIAFFVEHTLSVQRGSATLRRRYP
jgi:hypothetical protein